MPKPTKTILVDLLRHGEPEGGDMLRGRVDPVLTDLGWQQMRTATGLDTDNSAGTHTPPWTHVVSSPLKRCCEFARTAAQASELPLAVVEHWQEIDYGDWDGMQLSEWRKLAADQFRAFREDPAKLVPPNGEAFLDFRDRVDAAWQELCDLPDGSHLLLVTHGGVMRVILPMILGMPINRSTPLHIPFACFSRIGLQVAEAAEGREEKTGGAAYTASLLFHNRAHF